MSAKIRTVLGHGAFGALASGIMLPLATLATPTITVDRVQQRYPWNNVVDIDYTISGMDADANPLDYRVDLSVSALVGGEPVNVTASNYINHAWCDLPTANGTWRASWDSAKDGADFISDSARFELKLVYAPVAESEAEYLIVDISGGKNATKYPVRFARSCGMESSQFNKVAYKTDKIVLRRIKAGSFSQTSGGVGAHKVQLTHDFFLGIFEVTQGQYKNVTGSNPSSFVEDYDNEPAVLRPVEKVGGRSTVLGDNGFGTKLSLKAFSGDTPITGFTLPTAAQREYACRAGTTGDYYWTAMGGTYNDYEWCSVNSDGRPHAVGMKRPNAWGLYDMAGNVSEWLYDYSGAMTEDPAYVAGGITVDPMGPPTTKLSSYDYAGASYSSASDSLRSWAEGNYPTYASMQSLGIRICRTVE